MKTYTVSNMMYNPDDVIDLEKNTIGKILENKKLSDLSIQCQIKAIQYFPELSNEASDNVKSATTNIYFLSDVALYLWNEWYNNKSSDKVYEKQNDFITYCFPMINGYLFSRSYVMNKNSYSDAFQDCVLIIIEAMSKYDPEQGVSIGRYIQNRLRWDYYNILHEQLDEQAKLVYMEIPNSETYLSDAEIYLSDLKLLIRSICNKSCSIEHKKVLTEILNIIDNEDYLYLFNNLESVLKKRTGVSVEVIRDVRSILKDGFGGYNIEYNTDYNTDYKG
jgi:hypothetical protein